VVYCYSCLIARCAAGVVVTRISPYVPGREVSMGIVPFVIESEEIEGLESEVVMPLFASVSYLAGWGW
jgi:hypothetical protein